MPTEADLARAVFAQENARNYHRQCWGWLGHDGDREYAVRSQLRAAHHYAMARAMLGIEEYDAS